MPAMKRLGLVLALGACAAAPEKVDVARDTSRPVYSIAGFDPARISGDWVQVAGFEKSCDGGRLSVEAAVAYQLCATGGRVADVAKPTGVPGRFATPDGDLWVLWADADNRTLVIGGPDGRMGAVLNRGPDISADRLQAARDILAFNGYDVSRLVRY